MEAAAAANIYINVHPLSDAGVFRRVGYKVFSGAGFRFRICAGVEIFTKIFLPVAAKIFSGVPFRVAVCDGRRVRLCVGTSAGAEISFRSHGEGG
jgi:hypothetical protein